MNYGEYFGLDARNAYVATASLGNLGGREPMNAVYRTAGMARPIGGTTPQVWVLTPTGTMAGEVSLSPLPAPYTGSETGTYAQERGGTAYEFTNHLGNVLAVVSDKKLGQGGTSLEPFATYYHPETRMLTDYYPFGSPMVGRTWESGEYRYGFNGMQKDNEIVGEAIGYDFGARLYDGRLGRWWSVDPMAGEYSDKSPYCFVGNSPIDKIDLDGRLIGDPEHKDTKFFYGYYKRTRRGRALWKAMEKDLGRVYWFHVADWENDGEKNLQSFLWHNGGVGVTLPDKKYQELISGIRHPHDSEKKEVDRDPYYAYNRDLQTWEPIPEAWVNTHIVIAPQLINMTIDSKMAVGGSPAGSSIDPTPQRPDLVEMAVRRYRDIVTHHTIIHEGFHAALQRQYDYTYPPNGTLAGDQKEKTKENQLFEKLADEYADKAVKRETKRNK